MTIHPKLLYLARRNPALTREQFTPRWRQHGALGMSMPRWKNIWRYAHCDVVADLSGDPQGYDGVGIVWHKSPETRRAHREDSSSQGAMEADEVETFDQLVGNFCVLLQEREVMNDSGQAPFKLMRFGQRHAAITHDRMVEEFSPAYAAALLKAAGVEARVRAYVQNHAMPSESGRPWGLRYDFIDELWFDSVDDARAAELAARQVAPSFVRETLRVVLTNEVVLYQVTTN